MINHSQEKECESSGSHACVEIWCDADSNSGLLRIHRTSWPPDHRELPFNQSSPIITSPLINHGCLKSLSLFLSYRCKTPVENSLRDAELKFKDIDEVILVGGSTRIPAVQEVVRKLTGKEPNVTVNPDEVVALGAAVQAGVLAEDVSNIVLLDVTPL